jgi:hypothetical protein
MRWLILCAAFVASSLSAQDSTIKSFTAGGRPGVVTQTEEGRTIRLRIRRETASGPWLLEFRFRNDSLVEARERAADGLENRYNFADGRLVRWVARMAEGQPEHEQPEDDASFGEMAIRIPELARCWREFFSAADRDWTRWGDANGCAAI